MIYVPYLYHILRGKAFESTRLLSWCSPSVVIHELMSFNMTVPVRKLNNLPLPATTEDDHIGIIASKIRDDRSRMTYTYTFRATDEVPKTLPDMVSAGKFVWDSSEMYPAGMDRTGRKETPERGGR